MCLVKVKGEVEDDVIVPARVVERDETQIIETAPAIIERPARRNTHHRHSAASISSSSSSSSNSSRTSRRSRRSHRGDSSYQGSYGGDRDRDRRGTYYRHEERVISDGRDYQGDGRPRGSFRYVDPSPRGNRSSSEVKAEITRAEEHLQRAAELQRRARGETERRAIEYRDDPRGSYSSYRSRDGARRSDVVVIQEERERSSRGYR